MRSFTEWFRGNVLDQHKFWLILGKGPSFSKVHHFDTSGFYKFSLNDVVRELPVDVAHAIDLQVIERSGEAITRNAKALVMPWHPHIDFKPSKHTLEELSDQNDILRRLKAEGRLLWYNLSTAKQYRSGSPVISVRYFSAEAAINLLVEAGVRRIRSLGVDGGRSYSGAFKDLNDISLLANSRSSFDRQFGEIAKTILRTGVDYAPLDVESPIRIYVATMPEQMLAVKVLEYSIKKHASMTTEVLPLHLSGIEIPTPKDHKNLPRTPFSFQRFLIPQLAGYQGRAIYLDSDMQVFKDIRHLWTMEFEGADVLAARARGETSRRPQFSVMLLNCDALRWDIQEIVKKLDSGELAYEDLMYRMVVADSVKASIPWNWNSLEYYRDGETALLHYTDMNTQPWVEMTNPLGYLWFRDLFEAIDTGFVSEQFVREQIEKGHVRPSVGYQLTHRIDDSLLLPRRAQELDSGFVAPYMEIDKRNPRSAVRVARKLLALARSRYYRMGLHRIEQKIKGRLYR